MLLDKLLIILLGLLTVVCVELSTNILPRGLRVLLLPVQGIKTQQSTRRRRKLTCLPLVRPSPHRYPPPNYLDSGCGRIDQKGVAFENVAAIP
jgi:hypothetical protein